MGHSYSQNLVHCVYSTENRRNLILPELQPKLWAFKSSIAKRKGIYVITAGGTANHAHVLIALPPILTLARVLQTIKAYSSRWMSEHGVDFKWQEGYGAFSVSPSQIQTVVNYIQNQETHHAKRSFEEEFVFLLKSSGLEYDPRYVFGQSSQINRPSGTSPSFFSASHPGLPSWAKFFGGLPGLSKPPQRTRLR
jgi:REP element-mobilizing transposase RayT